MALVLYMCSIPGEGGMARKVPTKDSSIPKLFGGSLIEYVEVRHYVRIVINFPLVCIHYAGYLVPMLVPWALVVVGLGSAMGIDTT